MSDAERPDGSVPDTPARRDDRDRDARGRPRNARPRDALGRPLPRSGEGLGWRERLAMADEDVALPPVEAVTEAQRLIAAGRAFEAHEVLEAVWHVAPPEERDFWQGLAQVAVGLTHIQRGNARGAVALLRRGADRCAVHVGAAHNVDIEAVTRQARDLAKTVEESGLGAAEGRVTSVRLLA